jgi:sterol desaturase/sphingolipid hydroxylase (fatty acid hydroxylase superfamily)
MTFPFQSAATGMTACAGILLWISEGILPFFQGRRSRGSHAALNLGMAAVNLTIILPAGIATTSIIDGLHPVYAGIGALRLGPLTESLIVLLLLDLWMYLWHRINHELPFLWRFHAVHHSDGQLDVTSAWRFHPGEILFSELLRVPFLILVGASAWEILLYNLLMTPVIQFHHSNIRVNGTLDRLLRTVIPTPLLHRIHHSTRRSEHDSNYGAMLSIWDRLFGTLIIRPVAPSTPIGLEGESTPERQNLATLMKRPFLTPAPF